MKTLHIPFSCWATSLFTTGVLIVSGCHKKPLFPAISLTVLDADGTPPQEGHAVLIRPIPLTDSANFLGWEPISDTLHWDEATGVVEWAHLRMPRHAHWSIFSPDPIDPTSVRRLRIPATCDDSVTLTVSLPYTIRIRLARTVGGQPLSYSIESSWGTPATSQLLCDLHSSSGSICAEGTLKVSALPTSLSLVRHHSSSLQSKVVAQATIQSIEGISNLNVEWSDLDTTP